MKPIVKNILIGSALLLVAGTIWAKDKIDKTIAVFDKITILPNSLPRKIRFSNPNKLGIPQNISFDIDLLIKNAAADEFSVSGLGIATLETVDVFFKKNLIGTANVQLEEIAIPPQSNYVIQNVNFTGNTLSILSNANVFQSAKITDFLFISKVKIFDTIYEI